MSTCPTRRVLITWLVLVLATACSLGLVDTTSRGHARRLVGLAVLFIASFKAYLIGRQFMELRDAPLPPRLAFGAWLVALTATLCTQYWFQTADG